MTTVNAIGGLLCDRNGLFASVNAVFSSVYLPSISPSLLGPLKNQGGPEKSFGSERPGGEITIAQMTDSETTGEFDGTGLSRR